jgi:hypothetical protein
MPKVLHPVGGSLEHLDDVRPPKLGVVRCIGQPDPDFLSRDGVPDKDDPALMPRNTVPAMGHGPDVEDRLFACMPGSVRCLRRGC